MADAPFGLSSRQSLFMERLFHRSGHFITRKVWRKFIPIPYGLPKKRMLHSSKFRVYIIYLAAMKRLAAVYISTFVDKLQILLAIAKLKLQRPLLYFAFDVRKKLGSK